jgi:hypothetical protein
VLARTAGGPGLVRDVVATLRGAACEAALTSRQRAEIQNKLGQIIMQSDYPAAFRTELEGAIPYLDENSLDVARSMSVLGWPRADLCPADEHLTWLARAGRLPTDARSRTERLTVEINRATALLMLGQESRWEVAASVIRAAPAGAMPAEEQRLTAIWYLNSAFQAMLRGRYADAGQRLAAATQFAASVGDDRTVSHVVATRCHLDWLTEHWNGTKWTVVASPNPAGITSNYLYSVSTLSGTAAWTTGYDFGTSDRALVEVWNGKAWQLGAIH